MLGLRSPGKDITMRYLNEPCLKLALSGLEKAKEETRTCRNRFALGSSRGGVKSRATLFEKVRRAEDLGYATWSMADHVSGNSASVTVLAMAAAVTTSLRIGSCVFCHAFRHPVVLAREVATLDQLSEGRFELGLGPGYVPTDYHQIGLPLEEAGARISRFEEAVRLIKSCLTHQEGSFSGASYTATDLDNRPLPLQQPHPPLYIGGGKRMLQFAAREADIVGIGPKHGTRGMDMSEMTRDSTVQKRHLVTWRSLPPWLLGLPDTNETRRPKTSRGAAGMGSPPLFPDSTLVVGSCLSRGTSRIYGVGRGKREEG